MVTYYAHHASLGEDVEPTSGIRRQCRQLNKLLDNLTEWSGKTAQEVVRLAANRLANHRFIYKVAHAPKQIRHLNCFIQNCCTVQDKPSEDVTFHHNSVFT